MQRMWKQSPKQSVSLYDIRLHTKKPHYQKLHGPIGGRPPPPPPPPPLNLTVAHATAMLSRKPLDTGFVKFDFKETTSDMNADIARKH